MRLRPYGESGPLTVSFAALEHYLVTQGRAWERYAWLKARPLTGERHDELAALVTPFVYRKYLDYDAYDGLRGIHRQIREQEKRRDYAQDIKLGAGGIREIEFIVQALQIVRGGREPALRIARHAAGIERARRRAALIARTRPACCATATSSCAMLEHRLQYRDDRQTQIVPVDASERALIAEALDCASVAAFDDRLARASRHDLARSSMPCSTRPAAASSRATPTQRYRALWDDPSPRCRRRRASSPKRASTIRRVSSKRSRGCGGADATCSCRRCRAIAFDPLVPRLLAVAAEHRSPLASPNAVVQRLLGLLDAVSGRSAYLALLIEHPPLLPRLAQLMGASAWAADYLTRRPLLLDELLDARVLLAEAGLGRVARRARSRLLAAHRDDAERQMDALRHFQHAQTFRLLAQDLAGQLTVERLADHLSALADIDPRRDARALLAADARRRAQARRRASRSSATASSAARSSATRPTSTSSSSTTTTTRRWRRRALRAPRAAHQHVAHQRDGRRTAVRDRPALASRRRRRPARVERSPRSPLPARAGVDVGAPGADARALRRRRREHRRGVRSRRATQSCACRAIRRSSRADIVDMRARMAAEHPQPHAAVRRQARPGRHGRHRIRRAVPRARACARARRSCTRNAGNIALLRHRGRRGPRRRARWRSEAADAYREYRRLQHQIRLTGAPHARVDPARRRAARRRRRAVAHVSARLCAGRRCSAKIARFAKTRDEPPCRWPTATDGSGTTARWCRGATPRRTCSRTRCTTAWAYSRACAATRPIDGPAIFRLRDHTDRLFRSAQHLRDEDSVHAEELIEPRSARACATTSSTSCYLRPIAFYGSQAMGVAAKSNPVLVAIAAWPWGAYLGADGARKGHPRQDVVVHAPPSEHHDVQREGRVQLRGVDPRQPGSDARRLRGGDAARPAGLRLPGLRRERRSSSATASCTRPTCPAARSTASRATRSSRSPASSAFPSASGASRATRSTSPTKRSSPAPPPR